jgi:NAD(P) transhydrogenase
LIARKDAIAVAESARIRDNLKRHGVEYAQGHARFVDTHAVEIQGADGSARRIEGKFFLIATGSKPRRPPEIPMEELEVYDSDEILEINRLPASMVVLGGGVIGCEYACMFAALGVQVTLVEARPEILPFLDREIIERLRAAMENLGIRIVLGHAWTTVHRKGANHVACDLADGRCLESEALLFAAGRVGNSAELGLEKIGVTADKRGYIPVDASFRTRAPHVYAAGDVIGFPALASVSMEQARVGVCHAFGFAYKQSVAAVAPYGIYTIPEVSSIGETEQTCAEKNIDFVAGRALYRDNARGQITGDLEGITKLVVEATTRKVIGVHVIGERASELVHIGQAVMHLGGTVDVFIEMVFNYPTLSESFKYAAYAALGQLAKRKTIAPPR